MSALLESITAVVGPHGLVTDEATLELMLIDWRKRYSGRALAMVKPASSQLGSNIDRCQYRRHVRIFENPERRGGGAS